MKRIIFIWVITLFFTMTNWALAGPVTHLDPNQAPKPAPALSNQTAAPAPAGVPSQLTHPKPDLVIKSISFTKNIVHVGEDVGIVVKVANEGHGVFNPNTGKAITTRSGPTNLLVKVGGETSGQMFSIPPLTTGQTRTITRHFSTSHKMSIVIKAIIDPANTVIESKENNNDMTKTLKIWPKPDLAIIDFGTVPQGTLRLPGSFKVFAKIKNVGGLSSATNMQFDIDGHIPHDHGVVMHLTKPVPALGYNHTKTVYAIVTPVKAGTYILGGKVDQNNRVIETNEQNNFPSLIQIQVKKGGADLDLSVTKNHHRRHWYKNFVVTATVRNRGNLASGPFKVHLYRLHDYPAGSAQGSLIDMVKNCGSLGPNQSCSVSFTFKYHFYVGELPVQVKVDPELKVNDHNRANNFKTINLKVL